MARNGIKTGGRQKGSKNKTTLLFTDILEKEKENLLKVAIKLAKEGNATIMNKLLDKLIPSLQSQEIKMKQEDLQPKVMRIEYV